MPLLQSLDEEREHELLVDYNAFQDSIIAVYGDLDRRGNVGDRIGRFRQTGSMAAYILTFRELAAQIDWNKSSLIAGFWGGLKDEILDLVAIAKNQPRGLHDWMVMASQINERLCGQRQNR